MRLAKRVCAVQRSAVVRSSRNGHARAHGVTRPQQCAEVGGVGDPQRGDDEMNPTPVLTCAAFPMQMPALPLRTRRAHRSVSVILQ